jgi:hypothetical protein
MRNVQIKRRRLSGSGFVVLPAGGAAASKAAGRLVEERIHSLFEPDILISTQYLDTTRRKAYREPEKKLILAVLEDAIWCFQKGLRASGKRRRSLFHEAEEWIFDQNGGALFSFENVCDALDFEPEYLRKGLTRWKEEALQGRAAVKVYRITHLGERSSRRLARPREKGRRLLEAAEI